MRRSFIVGGAVLGLALWAGEYRHGPGDARRRRCFQQRLRLAWVVVDQQVRHPAGLIPDQSRSRSIGFTGRRVGQHRAQQVRRGAR